MADQQESSSDKIPQKKMAELNIEDPEKILNSDSFRTSNPIAPDMDSKEVETYQSYIHSIEILECYASFGEMYTYFLKKESESKNGNFTPTQKQELLYEPISDAIQNKLSRIWDLSVNKDMISCLEEMNAVHILVSATTVIPSKRISEILFGIVGNLGVSIVSSKYVCENILFFTKYLFTTKDNVLQTSLVRILHQCFFHDVYQSDMIDHFIKIALFLRAFISNFAKQQTLNNDFLEVFVCLLSDMLFESNSLIAEIANENVVDGLVCVMQSLWSEFGEHNFQGICYLLHLLTTDRKSLQLLKYHEFEVLMLITKYLKTFSSDMNRSRHSVMPSPANNYCNAKGLSSALQICTILNSDCNELLSDVKFVEALLRISSEIDDMVNVDTNTDLSLIRGFLNHLMHQIIFYYISACDDVVKIIILTYLNNTISTKYLFELFNIIGKSGISYLQIIGCNEIESRCKDMVKKSFKKN